jgi:FkbM family methyltransferase
MIIVQIGAYEGNDDLTKIIKSVESSNIFKIILVEPQKEFNDKLKECYKDYDYIIENVVITPNENETKVKFYHCFEDKNKEISSISKEHLYKHNQMNFIESELDSITVNNLLLKHKIDTLDILFIDAEGMDSEIIKSIDFNKFDIKKIYYENLHINNQELIIFLESKNYFINEGQLSNGWTNEAIKKY